MAMNDDELELAILKKYIDQHKLIGESNPNKCSRELDMRDVLREITGEENQDLDHTTIFFNSTEVMRLMAVVS